ncbi:Flp pilus assembly protein TadG [Rhodopirellula rubra]|uniref:Flp pilus assembly protein TadG n=1 Tax=Aporhodopirellula rubra TaxID=980271 RepID=A0A7W5E5L5_9BACT|nr:TadE/TadG family type IV pilus assembly protein [Aporhodopirellula rubra]MBB3210585.1 Flp pilus assembly protein TadG [Aporhodopirellula rubra]
MKKTALRPRGSRKRSRQGAALVEFAIVLPVMMLFFTAMIEISRILMLQHTADTAAYEAARSAMVPGATVSEAELEAQILLDAAGLVATQVTVSPSVITEETAFITVRVEVPVEENCWITPDQFTNSAVVSEVTLLTERSPIVRLTGIPELKAKKSKLKGEKTEL